MPSDRRQFDQLYRAFQRGDARYDGRFFIAVRTTGIYCVASCHARKPKRENVRFYFTREDAERGGFRPCRKCRPEIRGGHRALERAALRRWLDRLAEKDAPIQEVVRENGASPSRVYRLFRRHLGRGPRDARAQARLRRACDLLRAGRASITTVAYDAGFGSLATFYRSFRRGVGMTPAQFRARYSESPKRRTA